MRLHANAALGLAGRRKLVGLIEQGHSLRAAAAALGVSRPPPTAGGTAGPAPARPSARAAPAWPIARAPPIASPAA